MPPPDLGPLVLETQTPSPAQGQIAFLSKAPS